MAAVVVLDDFVTNSPKDENWQRLLEKLGGRTRQYVEAYGGTEIPHPESRRRRKPPRVRKVGGYFTRAGALADQKKKWAAYVEEVETGARPLEDRPTISGFLEFQGRGRTTLWRIYAWWGLLMPPDLGLDPDWHPTVEDGWIPPS